MTIRIIDWEKHYENSESRKYKRLTWVPLPNKHDGKGYRRIAALPDKCEIYSAWVLMVQIASKMPERGVLRDADGDLTAEDMAFITGFPEKAFTKMISALSDPALKICWITDDSETSGDVRKNSEVPPLNRTEQNRIEQNNKTKYGEFVSLTLDEHGKLVDEYGPVFTMECIKVLDNYKGANGKKYKSDYRAILNWVVDRVKEKGIKQITNNLHEPGKKFKVLKGNA